MRLKPDIEKVLARIEAFWAHEPCDRALIAAMAPKTPGTNISPFFNDRDFGGDAAALEDYWTNPETIRRVNLAKLEATFLGGESMPLIFQNYGTSGHCNYYGAVPAYGQHTIWFDPVLTDLDEKNIVFREDVLERHLAITRYLNEHAGDDYMVSMPDSCGTLDALGHLYGSSNVLFAMVEEPEQLQAAVRKINAGWARSNELFYEASRASNRGGSSHAWMHLWGPGRVMHLQADISVMISPQMYEEFVLPELWEQSQWCDYAVYHFDGAEQIKHLDFILSVPKIRAVQWTAVAGQPPAAQYMDTLRRIQAAGKGLIIMTPPEDVPVLLENLSATGLYLHCFPETAGEAADLVRYAEKNSKR